MFKIYSNDLLDILQFYKLGLPVKLHANRFIELVWGV